MEWVSSNYQTCSIAFFLLVSPYLPINFKQLIELFFRDCFQVKIKASFLAGRNYYSLLILNDPGHPSVNVLFLLFLWAKFGIF